MIGGYLIATKCAGLEVKTSFALSNQTLGRLLIYSSKSRRASKCFFSVTQ